MAKVLKDAGISTPITEDPMHETQYEELLAEKKTRLGGNIFEVGTHFAEAPLTRCSEQKPASFNVAARW